MKYTLLSLVGKFGVDSKPIFQLHLVHLKILKILSYIINIHINIHHHKYQKKTDIFEQLECKT